MYSITLFFLVVVLSRRFKAIVKESDARTCTLAGICCTHVDTSIVVRQLCSFCEGRQVRRMPVGGIKGGNALHILRVSFFFLVVVLSRRVKAIVKESDGRTCTFGSICRTHVDTSTVVRKLCSFCEGRQVRRMPVGGIKGGNSHPDSCPLMGVSLKLTVCLLL